jgi:hypothetical protein
LRLVNGSSYQVKHPEFVALPQTQRKLDIVYYGVDGVQIIELALIQELVLAEEPARAGPDAEGDTDGGLTRA